MTESVCLVGSGPSRKVIPEDMDVAALSSGYMFCDSPDLFITIDKARFFPLYNRATPVHVPRGQYRAGFNPNEAGPCGDFDLMLTLMRKQVDWCPGWADYPRVKVHETDWDLMPNFEDFDKPIGLGRTMNSIIFAVQLVHRLGYKTIHFAGCDMQSLNYSRAFLGMEWMYPVAKRAGYEWIVTSPTSKLCEFLPLEVPEGFIKIERTDDIESPWSVAG